MAEQRRRQWHSCLQSTLIALLSTHSLLGSALPFQETAFTSKSTGRHGSTLSPGTPRFSPAEERSLSETNLGVIFPGAPMLKYRDKIERIKSNELPASPAGLLKPDKFQFYTYNERGDMIMRQMTVEEIEALVAGGGAGHATLEIHEPQKAEDVLTGGKKVMDVVERVQNVLKSALGKKPETQKNENLTVSSVPLGASAEWSSILPSILEIIETETTKGGATGQGDLDSADAENKSTGTWESVTVVNNESTAAASSTTDAVENVNLIKNDTSCRGANNFVDCQEEVMDNVEAASHEDHSTNLDAVESTSVLADETTARVIIPATVAVIDVITTEKPMILVPVVTTGENLSTQSLEQQENQPVFEILSVIPPNKHYSQTNTLNSSDVTLQDETSKGASTYSTSTAVQVPNTHDDLDSRFTVTLEKTVTAKIDGGIYGMQDWQSTSRYDSFEKVSSRTPIVQESDPTTEVVPLTPTELSIGTQSSKVTFGTYQPADDQKIEENSAPNDLRKTSSSTDAASQKLFESTTETGTETETETTSVSLSKIKNSEANSASSSFVDHSTENPYEYDQDKYNVKYQEQEIAPPETLDFTSNTMDPMSEDKVSTITLEGTESQQRETETATSETVNEIKLTATWMNGSFEPDNDLPLNNVISSGFTTETPRSTEAGVILWLTHDSKTKTAEGEDIRKNEISQTTPDQDEETANTEDVASSSVRIMVESTEKKEGFQDSTQTGSPSVESSNTLATHGTESTYPTNIEITSSTNDDNDNGSIVTITVATDTTTLKNSNRGAQKQKEKPSNEKSEENEETMKSVMDIWTISDKMMVTKREEGSTKWSTLTSTEKPKDHSMGKDSNVVDQFQGDDSKKIQPDNLKKENEKDGSAWSKTEEGPSAARIPENSVNSKYSNGSKNSQIERVKTETRSTTDTYDSAGTEESIVPHSNDNGEEDKWTLISHQTVSSTKHKTQDAEKPVTKWSAAVNKQEQILNTIPVFPEHAGLENSHDDKEVATSAIVNSTNVINTIDANIKLEASKTASGLDASVRRTSIDIVNFSRVCNELAFNFWIATNKGLSSSRSLALSPFGMISLLSMIFLGARGPTSEQMNEILRLDDVVTFNPHLVFQNVTDAVGLARGQGVADAAFVRELFADKAKLGKLLPFYKEQAQQFYDGLVTEVNFATIGDLVRRRTNLLIRKQTGGRIRDFVKTNAMPLRSPLAAISANVFQTDCSTALASSEGRDGELYFAVSPEIRQRRLVPVPATVWRSTPILAGYEPALDATAIAIGGTSDRHVVSTIFVLPGQQGNAAPGDTLERLEHRLLRSSASPRNDAWTKLLAILVPRSGLEVQLPKFSHRSIINATAALKRMGLEQLFSEDADLKGINGIANRLYLTDAIQMNLFSICGDENIGSGRHHVEIYPASANPRTFRKKRQRRSSSHKSSATATKKDKGTTDKHTERSRLKLDRPFLYFVRHNPTGLILHMGRFNPRLLP